MKSKGSLPTPSIDWDAADPLQAFQEFWALAEFWLEEELSTTR